MDLKPSKDRQIGIEEIKFGYILCVPANMFEWHWAVELAYFVYFVDEILPRGYCDIFSKI